MMQLAGIDFKVAVTIMLDEINDNMIIRNGKIVNL